MEIGYTIVERYLGYDILTGETNTIFYVKLGEGKYIWYYNLTAIKKSLTLLTYYRSLIGNGVIFIDTKNISTWAGTLVSVDLLTGKGQFELGISEKNNGKWKCFYLEPDKDYEILLPLNFQNADRFSEIRDIHKDISILQERLNNKIQMIKDYFERTVTNEAKCHNSERGSQIR